MIEQLKKDRPSYVRFEKRPIEDRAESQKAGHIVMKDVDYAVVTPIGSKDMIPRVASEWFVMLAQQAREGRIPQEWVDGYKDGYARWQKGQEIPLNGTAIRGWGVLTPAQQESVIHANILTVEDLAQATAEATTRIGMGAMSLKEKASAWLKSASSHGKVAIELTNLKQENEALKKSNQDLVTAVGELKKQVDALKPKG